ncbi:MAG: hypothetical protein JNJ57_02400 [Saprospiraceae bacterium]|nr:hypothetical protein [Saprospiraceae bacterium]
MTYRNKLLFLIIGLAGVVLLGRYACYFVDKKYDTIRRPWAYSSDPSKPLLVGKWQGSVLDPDNNAHEVFLEIEEPLSDEKRKNRFFQKRIKRNRSSRTFFDGMAILASRGRRDTCEIWGGLDQPDGNQIHFQFRPLHDVHPPGFNLNLAEGVWQEHQLELSISFTWFRPDGSSFSDSADPRFEQKGVLKMTRIATAK